MVACLKHSNHCASARAAVVNPAGRRIHRHLQSGYKTMVSTSSELIKLVIPMKSIVIPYQFHKIEKPPDESGQASVHEDEEQTSQ